MVKELRTAVITVRGRAETCTVFFHRKSKEQRLHNSESRVVIEDRPRYRALNFDWLTIYEAENGHLARQLAILHHMYIIDRAMSIKYDHDLAFEYRARA